MPKKLTKDDYNNPHDENEPRTKYIPVKVNDHDLYDLKFNARRDGMQQATFVRYRLDLNEVKRGAKEGMRNNPHGRKGKREEI